MFVKKQAAIETIIGTNSIVRGELKSEATVRIDGVFEGRVRADCVVVGEAGTILGNVVCRAISVGGKIEGTLTRGNW
jgi:cytoskeletal protein CcmA (bactofilin family)